MTEPTTEAGRAYLAGIVIGKAGVRRAVLAIEAEAREGVTLTREPGLDVERLARALFEADKPLGWPDWDEYVRSFGHDLTVDDAWRMKAEAIAREYAALASEDRTGRVAHHTDGRGNCDPGVWMECRRCNPPALASEDRTLSIDPDMDQL